MLQTHKMTLSSWTGCLSGKSTPRTPQSMPDVLRLLTPLAQLFLNAIAPRAWQEATLLAVQLRVTVRVSFLTAISDGLTVQTTFSILTPCAHFNGRYLARSSQASRLFIYEVTQTTLQHPNVSGHVMDTLCQISTKQEHLTNSSIFHVLTSQKTLAVEAWELPVH